ncbi:MAG: helix-turn-helix domain-containing protein [Paludibacterium sp.]|uniref:helix-turn-helix domain-containing protein n=1 Tax=Paludibacterium sp. TaxID=1917523 RepID=UPI0025D1BA90|nr:helix-turn-helix transcriptional regulator [Paludibacterium sp.]MBV8046919.1 helix-turn-helix domain-containing protein [Paludibacterium sp.]MBV8646365.1 helix-turn-helix domain-containing protein [Paludibacterium sp.]
MAKVNIALSAIPQAMNELQALGGRLRACRIDRNLTIAEMAERMLCSINTYRDLEAGKPTASLGNFASALWLLGQLDTLKGVAPVPAALAAKSRAKTKRSRGLAFAHDDLDF